MREKALLPVVLGQEATQTQLGGIRSELLNQRPISVLSDAEFRVYSQFGEDGIIQFLIRKVEITEKYFVEFGVEDYRESNTRFLAEHDGWSGLALDGGTAHKDFIGSRDWSWKAGVEARSAFLTRENVNRVIGESVSGDIGILSIDIDGVDYWLLEALDVISPRILIMEYNSLFGPQALVTVPYRPDFDRFAAHPSGLYFGASIAALALLAAQKGYELVGGNTAGCNAFFVRRDVLGELAVVSPGDAWVRSRFRGVLDGREGRLGVDGHELAREAIPHLPLLDVATERIDRADRLLKWDGVGS